MNNSDNYIFNKHTFNGELCFDIEQKDLIYADLSPTRHGL